MKRNSWPGGALLGAVTIVPVIGLMSLGNRLAQLPFLPFDLFDWLTRVLPGWLIVPSIGLMVRIITALNVGPTASTAKTAEHSLAVLIFILGGGLAGAVLAGITGRRPETAERIGTIGGVVLSAAAIAIEASLGFTAAGVMTASVWIIIVLTVWGWLVGRLLLAWPTRAPAAEPAPRLSRRQFLAVVGGGAAATTLAALGLSNWLRRSPPPPATALPPIDTSGTSGPAASPSEPTLAARIAPARDAA